MRLSVLCGILPGLLGACDVEDSRATPAAPLGRSLAGQLPNLARTPDGRPCLSWVESTGPRRERRSTLRFSRHDEGGWSAPLDIASGERWFVNWADFPAVVPGRDGRVAAHFLQYLGSGTYDYGVRLVCSRDGGASWDEPRWLHEHVGPGEHGFVSIVPLARGFFALWLDGREAGGDAHGDGHGGGHEGDMGLWCRTIDDEGALGPERRLDERVCSCCQTDAVALADGRLVVAYRDRDEEEVRDIRVARITSEGQEEAHWRSGDGWKIPACPVNGPALAAHGDRVGLAWFTLGSDAVPRVCFADSEDGARSFSPPRILASGTALGRVDVCIDAEGTWHVSWLDSSPTDAAWKLASFRGSAQVVVREIAASGRSRSAGFGRLLALSSSLLFAHTDGDEQTRVEVLEIAAEPRGGA